MFSFSGNMLNLSRRAIALGMMCLCGTTAHAVDVDFDSLILRIDSFLERSSNTTTRLRDKDNDANGIKEPDQLGMLSEILAGGSNVNCINAGIRTALNTAYTANLAQVPLELVLSLPSPVGTINVISQLNTTDAGLGDALQKLLAGYMTIADSSTITFVNTLADELIAGVLKGTPQESETTNAQNQITFTGVDFLCHGGAAGETDYIGPRGDIDGDSQTNVQEYADGAVFKTREEWLISNCIQPTLRLVSFSGGGLRISGLKETFRVETAGAAGPVTYTWRKGTATSSTVVGSTQEFVINFLTSASNGSYFCVVSDGVSTRTTPSATLSVTNVPIFFATQPAGATRNPGSNYTFSVSVQGGNPGPYTYQWKKGNANIGANSPTLTLTNLKTSDAGTYRCTVTSNGGGDSITSSAAVLNVRQVNFSLTTQPQGAKKYLGQSHTLSVGVSGGSGNFSYVWKRNGSSFGAANSASITLNNLQLANAGSYTCTVTDTLNPSNTADTDAALVEVAAPLQIVTQPVGGTVQVGGLIILTVSVTGGFNPLTYQWRWNGVPITGQSTNVYTAIALSGFEGEFSCRITDANGTSVTSSGAEITLAPEIFINSQPASAKKYTGQSHTLSVTASGGSPPLAFQWYKDGNSLGAAARNSTLVLSSLTTADDGTYFCRVTDEMDSIKDSEPAELRVANPPAFTQHPESRNLVAGETLTLSVTVSGGIPPLTYQWRKDNTPILGSNARNFSKSNVSTADQGQYHCRVTDGIGTSISSNIAIVNVSSVVQITQQPIGGTAVEGDDFTFSVSFTGGNGSVSEVWLKDGVSLGAPSLPNLTLQDVTLEDAGFYQVQLIDNTGVPVTSAEAELVVVERLRIEQQPQSGNYIEGDTVNISVTPGGGQGPYTYQWYLGPIELAGEQAQTLIIEDAGIPSTGLYRVIVQDDLGQMVESEDAAILVAPEILITQHPSGADKYTGTSHLLRVAASGGNGNYTYFWRKNGETVPGSPNAPEFTLESLEPGDSGFYDCVVTETQGGAAASFPVYVRVRDFLSAVSQPEGRVMAQGTSHTLEFVVAGGFEPLSYQWLKNDQFIPGATGPAYTIESATLDDEGIYACVVADSVASIIRSDEVEISVVEPIRIVAGLQGGARAPGQDFTFTLTAAGGGGTLHYAWFKDDEQLDVTDAPQLVLNDLELADQGVYYCIVTDEANGLLKSNEAQLTVSESPISIDVHPSNGERYPGEPFTFTTAATGGVGALTYQWRRNTGQGFADIGGATSPTLNIAAVAMEDAGQYRCRISDENGQALLTFAAELKVIPRVSIVSQPQDTFAYIGTDVTLTVVAAGGIGAKAYAWFKDGTPLGINSPTLTLQDVDEGDAAGYTCAVAATRDSEITQKATLTIGQPLQLLTQPQSLTRFIGETLDFDVETAGGVGPIEFQWYKDDAPFRNTKALVIGKLSESDAGNYSLVISDELSAIGGEIILSLDVLPVEGELPPPQHSGDEDNDGVLSLTETLGIIQLYNAGGYHCDEEAPGGFGVGPNPEAPTDCALHSSDYEEPYRVITLTELLRAIQFFHLGYWYCPSNGTEDNYCAGAIPEGEGGA